MLTAPAVDYRPLADALTNIVPEIDELRLDVEDDQPFTDRVHELIGAIWLTFYALSTLLAHLLLTLTSLLAQTYGSPRRSRISTARSSSTSCSTRRSLRW